MQALIQKRVSLAKKYFHALHVKHCQLPLIIHFFWPLLQLFVLHHVLHPLISS